MTAEPGKGWTPETLFTHFTELRRGDQDALREAKTVASAALNEAKQSSDKRFENTN